MQVWRSSADRREQIPSVIYDAVAAAKARMQTYFSAIQQDVFIIKRTLWKNSARFTGFWRGVSGCISGDIGSAGWYHRTECLAQARQFAEVANVSGIILTKLDGTAKEVLQLPSSLNWIFR